MANSPIPLSHNVRILTPAGPVPVAAGLAEVTHQIITGLPSTVPLGAGFDAVLLAAGGLARTWMQAEPDRVVSDAASIGEDGATPLRLLVRSGGKLVASVPLARGPLKNMGHGTLKRGAGPRVGVQILDWRVHAGTVLQAGDFGSFIRLAWVHLGIGANAQFAAPKARSTVLRRLAATPTYPLPRDPDLARGLGQPEAGEDRAGSGRWTGYGWEDRNG